MRKLVLGLVLGLPAYNPKISDYIMIRSLGEIMMHLVMRMQLESTPPQNSPFISFGGPQRT